MRILARLQQFHEQARRNRWFRAFTIFCRVALAASFIPSGIVKIMGERFTALPSNHPLGHYFDALHQTGYYYTFLGISQIIISLLLLVPRTAFLGALAYFPVILNIGVLTYATRFEGTRIITLMVLADLYLLAWDYQRFLPLVASAKLPKEQLSGKFPVAFSGLVVLAVAAVVFSHQFIYDIRPGNSEEECRNGCPGNKDPKACLAFCDCIYTKGRPLDSCLAEYENKKRKRLAGE